MFRSLDKAEKEKERMESHQNEEDGHEDKREGTGDNSSPQTPDNDAAPISTVRQRYTRLQLTSFAQSNSPFNILAIMNIIAFRPVCWLLRSHQYD